jgi:hypothetical protein
MAAAALGVCCIAAFAGAFSGRSTAVSQAASSPDFLSLKGGSATKTSGDDKGGKDSKDGKKSAGSASTSVVAVTNGQFELCVEPYEAQSDSELTLAVGDMVQDLSEETEQGWKMVQLVGKSKNKDDKTAKKEDKTAKKEDKTAESGWVPAWAIKPLPQASAYEGDEEMGEPLGGDEGEKTGKGKDEDTKKEAKAEKDDAAGKGNDADKDKDSGNKEADKKDSGKKDTDKKDSVKKETDKKDTDEKDSGKKEISKKDSGKKESDKKDSGKESETKAKE